VHGLSLGVTYHSAASLNFSGNANFSAPAVYRPDLPPDGTGKTTLTLPQNIAAGVAYKMFDAFELEVDFNWTNWSSFQNLTLTLPGGTTQVLTKSWVDTIAIRVGADYTFFHTTEHALSIRAGFAYDQTPVPATTLDFTLPDVDRDVITVGVGYQILRQLRADLGAEFILPASRTTSSASPYAPPIKGSYDVSAVLLGLNVIVKIDTPKPAEDKR
jgi:long-chain fatty acid transport protein